MPDNHVDTAEFARVLREVWRDSTGEGPFQVGQRITTRRGQGVIVTETSFGDSHTYGVTVDGEESIRGFFPHGFDPEDFREAHDSEQAWLDHLAAEDRKAEEARAEWARRDAERERQRRRLINRLRRKVEALRSRLSRLIAPSDEYDDYH